MRTCWTCCTSTAWSFGARRGTRGTGQRLTFSCSQIDLPQRLSSALKGATGASTPWFCDFRADNTKYVVFRGQVLHYRVGDAQGRADVVRACEAMGIPAHQTNWED